MRAHLGAAQATLPSVSVLKALGDAAPKLSAAERRVAVAISDDPRSVAFGTMAELVERSLAGAGTIARLCAKLGFDGYSALQRAVQDELVEQLRPAALRIRESVGGEDLLGRIQNAEVRNLAATLDGVSRPDFTAALTVCFMTSSDAPGIGNGSLVSALINLYIVLAGEIGADIPELEGFSFQSSGKAPGTSNPASISVSVAASDKTTSKLGSASACSSGRDFQNVRTDLSPRVTWSTKSPDSQPRRSVSRIA